MNNSMRVKLIAMTPNPIDVMWTAARTCYSAESPINIWDLERYNQTQEEVDEGFELKEEWIEERQDKMWKLIKTVLDSGHQSIAEHVSFTFAISGLSRACYDDKTEVLTKDGWKLFKFVNTQDSFATINDEWEVEFQKATDFISYDYNGKLHSYKSQNIDLCVTPNHNMLIKKFDIRTASTFNLVPSENITVKRFYMTKNFPYNKNTSDNINILGYSYLRNYKNNKVVTVKTSDLVLNKEIFFPFMAWYLSDGSVYYNEKENSYTISISQTKCEENLANKTRERIKELIENLGFTATLDEQTVKFKSQTLGKFLKGLGHCNEKFIPWNIYEEFNQPLAKLFIDEYFKGDGHIDKNGCGKLYTSSKLLAEQLYQLCFMAGYTCKQHEVAPRGSHYIGNLKVNSTKVSYVINVTLREQGRNKNVVVKKDKHFSEVDYNGKVYCVTVPNHTLFVRRNGVAVWCGNCSHQLVRHRAGIVFSQQSQRYVEIKEDIDILEGRNFTPDTFKDEKDVIALLDKYFVWDHECYAQAYSLIQALYCYLYQVREGAKAEDARVVLPNATKTNIVMTVNYRELIHLCNLRLCTRAQEEIRDLFGLIKMAVKIKDERLGSLLVPTCEANGFCKEHKCCGRKPKAKDVLEGYKRDKNGNR